MSCPVNIVGLSACFPSRVKRNSDFPWAAAGLKPERIDRTGIEERRWAEPHETILDFARGACENALETARVRPEEVDRLFLVTSTLRPGIVVPSGAVILQDQLGMRRCQTTTLLETCCGSLVAMEHASALIRSGMARNVVVVASETFSKTFNPTSPLTFEIGMSMGDGAAAVVLSGRDDLADGLVTSFTRSCSDFQGGLGMQPLSLELEGSRESRIAFGASGGPPTFRGQPVAGGELIEALKWFTTSTVPMAVAEALREARLSPEEVNFYVLHQPNRTFLEGWKRVARIPEERTLDTLARYGNLSSVSVLANLHAAWELGRLNVDDIVLMASAGEGATWGAMVWKWRLPREDQH